MDNVKLTSRFAPIWASEYGCRGWMKMNADQIINQRSKNHQSVIDIHTQNNVDHLEKDIIESANLFYETIEQYKSKVVDNNYFDVSLPCENIHSSFEAKIDFYTMSEDVLTIIKFESGHTEIPVKHNMDLVSQAVAIKEHHETIFNRFKFVIVQPLSYSEEGSVRSWTTDCDFIDMNKYVLSICAKECFEVDAETLSGSHCKSCFARKKCNSALKASTQLFEVASDTITIDLTPAQMGLQLKMINRSIEALKTLKTVYESQIEYELGNAVSIPGWELKPSYGRETWTCDIDEVIQSAGDINISKTTLITPSHARKLGFDTEGMTTKPSKGFKVAQSKVDASEIFSK